jgi:hypothetical protein
VPAFKMTEFKQCLSLPRSTSGEGKSQIRSND